MLVAAPDLEIQPIFNTELSPAEILEIRSSSLKRLSTLLRLVEGGWALAVYESGSIREQMEEGLGKRIAPLPLRSLSLVGRTPDPLGLIGAESGAPVLSLHSFANRIADFCGFLDVQRESLARHPHRLLIWATPYEQRILAQTAPNFYSRLSGIFHFPGGLFATDTAPVALNGAPAHSAAPREAAQPPSSSGARRRPYLPVAHSRDRQQQTDYLLRRLRTLQEEKRPDFATIGDSWYDLAGLHETDLPNRWGEAEAAYGEAARAYAQCGNTLAEAEARYQAGDAAMRNYTHAAALAHFDSALRLYRFYDERSARLGEANVLKAQGDVLYFLKKTDEALAKYELALALFQAVGARLGEANVLAAQGQVELIGGNEQQADAMLAQAVAIYQRIGDRYSVPAQIGNYGWALRRADRKKDAVPYLRKAAELFEIIGLDDYAKRHLRAADDF